MDAAKTSINLKNSINTASVEEDIYTFGDGAAPAIQNTGIERDGGITNIYETKKDYVGVADRFITEDGDLLESTVSGDIRSILINGKQIGQASAYGVGSRLAINGVDDACITSTNTYLTIGIKGSGVEVNEYSTAQVLLNTRTTIFTNLSALLSSFTSISIIRYNGIKFVDSLEFCLRLGDQTIILQEAAPTIPIAKIAKMTNALGSVAGSLKDVLCSIVMGDYLIVAGTSGRVASFDGAAWKNYDGSGGGTGPYNDGTAIGFANVQCMCLYAPNADNIPYLVIAGTTGKLASYQNGQWFAYNTAGSGVWNNATVLGVNTITSMVSFTDDIGVHRLIVAGNNGRLGSFDPVGGWVIYTAGAGIRDNGTLIGANHIYNVNIMASSTFHVIIVSGAGGRVGSIKVTGGVFTFAVYTVGTSVTNPTNNGTVVGADDIRTVINWISTDLVLGSSAGKIGYLKAGVWYNYNGAGGAGVIINNATAVGADLIFGFAKIITYLVVAGFSDRIGSYDGSNWKNYDGTGTGTGPYAGTGIALTGMQIYCAVYYKNQVVISGQNSTTTGITLSNYIGKIIVDLLGGGQRVSDIIMGQSESAYLYMYRYENGYYFSCLTGNSLGMAYVTFYNGATLRWEGYPIRCKYAVPQISSGKTRHLVAGIIQPSALGEVQGIGLVGYTDFVNFSGQTVYPTGITTWSTTLSQVLGFNYVDAAFKLTASASNIYSYAPQFVSNPTNLFKITQSNTNTLINAYGKITNGFGVVPSVPVELRIGLVNGVLSFISAATLDGIGPDAMGTLLTNVGEIDPTYTPDFKDDRIIYRYNGVFYYIILTKTLTNKVFQKIGEKVYKVNAITPLNIISMVDQRLHIGSSDYNGRMLFESTTVPAVVATKVASLLSGSITADPLAEGIFSNSIDVGDKLVYITGVAAANIAVIGFRIPYGYQSIREMISTYIADIYAFSTGNDGTELVMVNPNNPIYVSDTRLPLAIGFEYSVGTVNTGQQTIFLNKNYDGYILGNEAKGIYSVFILFGVTYLYDGDTIYQASIANNIYSGLTAIASAIGMQFIAVSPTMAYFLSTFDNSIYVFTGARALDKFQRLNSLPSITKGIYSVKDNSLLLDTATTFIWVRDNIVSQNLKTAVQVDLKYYDTTLGLIISNDTSKWRYTYSAIDGTSTLVPLTWQSAFYGLALNEKAVLSNFMVTIYVKGKDRQVVTGTVRSFDEGTAYSQAVVFEINPKDYTSSGYYRFRVQPKSPRSLGISLELTFPAKTVLLDVVAMARDDTTATRSGAATK